MSARRNSCTTCEEIRRATPNLTPEQRAWAHYALLKWHKIRQTSPGRYELLW